MTDRERMAARLPLQATIAAIGFALVFVEIAVLTYWGMTG